MLQTMLSSLVEHQSTYFIYRFSLTYICSISIVPRANRNDYCCRQYSCEKCVDKRVGAIDEEL